jgi:hypothetical protein
MVRVRLIDECEIFCGSISCAWCAFGGFCVELLIQWLSPAFHEGT